MGTAKTRIRAALLRLRETMATEDREEAGIEPGPENEPGREGVERDDV